MQNISKISLSDTVWTFIIIWTVQIVPLWGYLKGIDWDKPLYPIRVNTRNMSIQQIQLNYISIFLFQYFNRTRMNKFSCYICQFAVTRGYSFVNLNIMTQLRPICVIIQIRLLLYHIIHLWIWLYEYVSECKLNVVFAC